MEAQNVARAHVQARVFAAVSWGTDLAFAGRMLVRNLFAALGVSVTFLTVAACGAHVPPPTDRLAGAEAAARSAHELGADQDPNAALHVKLADEQIGQAKTLMHDNDNQRADRTLQRASADAELAIVLVKERTAEAAASKAKEATANQKAGK